MRSASYLKNKQKQKSAPAAFRLTALEALITPKPETHISPYLPIVTRSSAPFLMPIHFTLPYGGKPMHLVCVFEADRDPTDEEVRASASRFCLLLYLLPVWRSRYAHGCITADSHTCEDRSWLCT